MTLTDDEKNVLREIERRINTVTLVVNRITDRTFKEDDLETGDPLVEALDECRHDLRVVQLLD